MIEFLRALFRHFKLPMLGPILVGNLVCLVPFAAALIGPVAFKNDPTLGLAALVAGFVVTGQAIAVSGRWLDRRFQNQPRVRGGLWTAWAQGWAEGLVVAALLLAMFSLLFQSVPFYWEQGTAFAVFSLMTLGIGSVLVLGFLPYYLPARRREGLGLGAAFARAFRLMNQKPGLAFLGLLFGLASVLATAGTLGLFPGFTGLAALHQGLWDRATKDAPGVAERPGNEA